MRFIGSSDFSEGISPFWGLLRPIVPPRCCHPFCLSFEDGSLTVDFLRRLNFWARRFNILPRFSFFEVCSRIGVGGGATDIRFGKEVISSGG